MFHLPNRALYLSIDDFSHSRVDDIFAAARGPTRVFSNEVSNPDMK